ncbi:MAG: hypothetical protein IBX55_19615 [Methyloprofundus sp.]|nr:hypothetical protein [Methyloprofundus sp.]
MKHDAYLLNLRKLLVENYQTQAKTKKISPKMAYHIQGYMEAGLVSGMASKDSLEEVINQAHVQVFGIPFEERKTLEPSQTDLLDIPTWIRNRKERV